jgi:hypothetical protein
MNYKTSSSLDHQREPTKTQVFEINSQTISKLELNVFSFRLV